MQHVSCYSYDPMLRAMLVGAVLILNGCDRMPWPANKHQRSGPVDEFVYIGPGAHPEYAKHNYTSVSAAGWTADLWTSGAVYVPWEGVDITVRLAAKDPKASPPAETVVQVNLLEAKTGEKGRHREIRPTFVERRDDSGVAWEAPLLDVFQSDMGKQGGQQLAEGSYRIGIGIVIGPKTELKVDSMVITVEKLRGL